MGRHWFPWRCTTRPCEPDEGFPGRPEVSPTKPSGLSLSEALVDLRGILQPVGIRQRTKERGARRGADTRHQAARAHRASNIVPRSYPETRAALEPDHALEL